MNLLWLVTYLPIIFAGDPSPANRHRQQNTAVIFGDHLNNARTPSKNNHDLHAPEVAFHCGYKNKYVDQSTGEWLSDKAIYATCLAGKLDILKYCRKVYPHLQITNIVEAENQLTISDWCKAPEGSTCKWSFLSRPFKCLVGEFESEALLVPQGCHFGHVDDRSECKDFDYWNRTAQLECSKRLGDLHVESFSMLEPCGLDMFSGVEYVCCPKNSPSNVQMNMKIKLDESKKKQQQKTPKNYDDDDVNDEDEDDDEEDDNEYEDQDNVDSIQRKITKASITGQTLRSTGYILNVKAKLLGAQKFSANKSDESSEDNDDENDTKPVESLDVYFRVADPDNEHEAYQKAIERLERKHKNKVSTVMQEWSELEKRYNAMLQKDPKHAQNFRHEMTTRFQKTIAALEGERKDQRRQIDEVHQQRVESTLNERKRDAIKRYRDSLADSKRSSPRILRYLESYIRAEEKDRVHALNRYIHLLKTDSEQAFQWKALLLRKLHDIDLRVNGTVTLLKELPAQLEAKIKKNAYEFWHKFRLEHTPEVGDETLIRLDYTFNDRLLNAYEKRYKAEISENKAQAKANQIAVDSVDVASPLSSSPSPIAPLNTSHSKTAHAQQMTSTETARRLVEQLGKTVDAETKRKQQPIDDVVVFDPVVEINDDNEVKESTNSLDDDDSNAVGAFSKQNIMQHEPVIVDHYEERLSGYNYVVFSIAGVALIASVLIGTIMMRRRNVNHRKGFIEVDACTPEERHVALMQGNGYENPTYKYFDEKI